MLIYFNQKDLTLQVQVGSLEKYEPTPEIKQLVAKARELKKKHDDFYAKVFEPEMKQLLDIIDRINVTANPELAALRNKNAGEKGT